jgi:hypothetical protein
MKYTRSESNEVIEVKGCTTCPHMVKEDGLMVCRAPAPNAAGEFKPRKKKLTSHWAGAYHASCPLAIKPESVPVLKDVS